MYVKFESKWPKMLIMLTKQLHQARVLRYLTQRFIFEEPSPFCYVQNIMSKALTMPVAEAWIDLM